jgi:hypothetical protein
MAEFKYEIGLLAEDKLTGFRGIITYRAQYITGCNNYGLQPNELDEKGSIRESAQFDENRIRIIGDGISLIDEVKEIKEEAKEDPGGPQPFVGQQQH